MARGRPWTTRSTIGATLLPYNLKSNTVLLVRHFRYPAYVNGYDDLLMKRRQGCLTSLKAACLILTYRCSLLR